MPIPLRTALALSLLLAPASAQGIAYQWPQVSGGQAVASAGDVDGDGVADFAIGSKAGGSVLGHVEVRSGDDGNVLWSVEGTNQQDGFGSAVVGLGDVDGDGLDDLAAAAANIPSFGFGPLPYVRVLSGADGSTLWQAAAPSTFAQFGRSLARIADLDGDGADDLIIGSSNAAPDSTQVRSGATGELLFAVAPPSGARLQFGMCVDALGDLDGDGYEDFGVGDPSFGAVINGYARGRITLHSGFDGSLLGALTAPAQSPAPWGSFGSRFDGLGDVDGDGLPDLAVGAPLKGTIGSPAGMVWIMSCADGSILQAIAPEIGSSLSQFGSAVARTDDVDGDGVVDLRIGAGSYVLYIGGDVIKTTAAELRTYSGATGALLQSWEGMSTPYVAAVPDANGDGRSDVLLVDSSGVLLVLDGLPNPLPWPVCPGQDSSNGCTPYVTTTGAPSLTQFGDLEVHVSQLPLDTVGLCLYGPNPTTTPFGGSVLCVAPPFVRTPLQPSTTDPFSCGTKTAATFTSTLTKLDLAGLGLPPGDGFYVQGWFRDPGLTPPNDFGLSGALFVELWP